MQLCGCHKWIPFAAVSSHGSKFTPTAVDANSESYDTNSESIDYYIMDDEPGNGDI
jgi:hypothetical protein